jgi:hypothetical protein
MPPHVLRPLHTYVPRLASLDVCVSRMHPSFAPQRYRHRVVISWTQGCCCKRRSVVAFISYSNCDFGMSTVACLLTSILILSQWQSLITHRGPYDPCNGLQLVLAALLGQVYAALSKVRNSAEYHLTVTDKLESSTSNDITDIPPPRLLLGKTLWHVRQRHILIRRSTFSGRLSSRKGLPVENLGCS